MFEGCIPPSINDFDKEIIEIEQQKNNDKLEEILTKKNLNGKDVIYGEENNGITVEELREYIKNGKPTPENWKEVKITLSNFNNNNAENLKNNFSSYYNDNRDDTDVTVKYQPKSENNNKIPKISDVIEKVTEEHILKNQITGGLTKLAFAFAGYELDKKKN